MTDQPRNFVGIPISGEIRAGSTRIEQRPQDELEVIIRRVLDDPFFVEFGWSQYTPYFNDGEPCEFTAYAPWIRTQNDVMPRKADFTFQDGNDDETDETEEERNEGLTVEYGHHPSLGTLEYPDGYWDMTQNPWVRKEGTYVGTREAQFHVARELDQAINGGQFENVLLNLFGDHCQVRVTRDGITIDEYSHD